MPAFDIFPLLTPDYTLAEPLVGGALRGGADSGRVFQRQKKAPQRLFELQFLNRTTDEAEQLRAWHAQFQRDYFIFYHPVYVNNAGVYAPRSFPVTFAAEPEIVLGHNEAWDMRVALLEAVGAALGQQFLASPRAFDNAAWGKNQCVVTATNIADPLGFLTADRIDPDVSSTVANFFQTLNLPKAGLEVEFRIWLKAASGSFSVDVSIADPVGTTTQAITLTTSWQEFSLKRVIQPGLTFHTVTVRVANFTDTEGPVDAWDGRLEYTQSRYPDPAFGHPTYFKEEDGSDAFAAAGTWTPTDDADASNNKHKTNPNTNTTDKFRFLYAGYGFRLRGVAAPIGFGIYDVVLDGVTVGQVDLHVTPAINTAVLFTKLDVPLGVHTVDIKATNTRNGGSSANTISADAIEIIP